MTDEHRRRTYHGVSEMDDSGSYRIFVEAFGGDFTARERGSTLYELHRDDPSGNLFSWGYRGGSAGRTARALLDDALGESLDDGMILDFLDDVVAHLDSEWRLNRTMIVRWASGWHTERDTNQGT